MKLLNCICGSEPKIVRPDDIYSFVRCPDCRIRSVTFVGADDDEVIENWNNGVKRGEGADDAPPQRKEPNEQA